ncbi:MAG: Exodeoxyribonuclease, partial [Candidatus Saccharibacteria bacterium]|nr:Exodeoxyribonuclease [Candidatus Saccharibacteria bacterium]
MQQTSGKLVTTMAASFFFYDLETTGFDAREGRVMQFAGQRTDMELNPIGDPVNLLIKLTADTLPSPDAILVTGITPQQTLADGVTEAEFLKIFYDQVVQPDTIFVGFNSIRFDDEFMRFLHYRNFYDPYEWQWANGCSRWDILDLVRMTRALRPEGIEWPFNDEGKPANRLELLTKVNKLDHENAHDALNDVYATIAVAKLIREKQKDLFEYLLGVRDKKKAAEIIETGNPFVYSTGRYSGAGSSLCTSVAVLLAKHPQPGSALVFDLRHDPTPFLDMSVDELIQAWRYSKDPEALRLPVKSVKYNRSPAVAPLGVIKDEAVQERIELKLETITKHLGILQQHRAAFAKKILEAVEKMDAQRDKEQQTALDESQLTVDSRLYDKFIDNGDKQAMRTVRTAKPEELNSLADNFHDDRLKMLLPLYKARNYPKSLDSDERAAWDAFCAQKLFDGGTNSRLARYFARLAELANGKLTDSQKYLLEELQLYG